MEIEIHYPRHIDIQPISLNITSSMATEAIEVRDQPHFRNTKTNIKIVIYT